MKMKKMSLLLVICLLLLTSCVSQNGNGENINSSNFSSDDPSIEIVSDACFIRGNHQGIISQNTAFFAKLTTGPVTYNFFDDIQSEAILLTNYFVGTEDDNPFMGMSSVITFMINDEEATLKNDGMPVVYILFKYSKPVYENGVRVDFEDFCKILRCDTSSLKFEIIKDDISPQVQSFDLYKDIFIYTTNDGDQGYNIHCINKDGSNYRKMDNPDKRMCRVQTVYRDKLYYHDERSGQIYVCNVSDFGNTQVVCKANIQSAAFAYNGYLYFSASQRRVDLGKGKSKVVCDIHRVSVDDFSKSEQVIEGVLTGNLIGDKYYYFHIDNVAELSIGPGKPGSGLPAEATTIVDGGYRVCLSYDPMNGKTETFYDMGENYAAGGYLARYPIDITDDYVLFYCNMIDSSKSHYQYMDRTTNIVDVIPHNFDQSIIQ